MKKLIPDGRRSKTSIFCARLTLAAFFASLPGPQAWAQVAERAVAPVSPVVTPVFAAPAPALSVAPLSAAAVTALSAPSLTAAVPLAAPAALSAAAADDAASAPAAVAPAAAAAVDAAPASATPSAVRPDSAEREAFAGAEAATLSRFDAEGARFDGASPRGEGGGDGANGVPPDESNRAPTTFEKNALLDDLTRSRQGGELLSPQALAALGRKHGWSAGKSTQVANALAGDNDLARLSESHYLFVDIEARASGKYDDQSIDRANVLARTSLGWLNHPNEDRAGQLARALAALGGALRVLPEDQAAYRTELGSLYRNVAMELARAIAERDWRARVDAHAGNDAVQKARALVDLTQGIHYDGGQATQPLSEVGRAAMMTRLDQLKTERPSNEPAAQEVQAGFSLLKAYLASHHVPAHGASSAAASGPAGGSAGSGGSNDGGGKGGALVVFKGPPEAPVIALDKVYFPGVHRRGFRTPANGATAAQLRHALANGGFFIAATASGGAARNAYNSTAVLARAYNPVEDGGALKVTLEFVRAAKISGYAQAPNGPLLAKATYPASAASDTGRLDSLSTSAKLLVRQYAAVDPETIPDDLVGHVLAEESPVRLANLLAEELPLPLAVKLRLLDTPSDETRLQDVVLELMSILKEKQDSRRAAVKDEDAPDPFASVDALKARLKAIGMPEAVQKTTLREYERLAQMNPKDSEAQKLRTYVEWLIDVPWGQRTQDVFDIPKAREILDADHSGLEYVKDRVLEFLAVRKKTGSVKGAIICFVGPPGVGKTSIAGGIAAALGRKFVRLSLGGVHDESELRGHGRTYVGSMPGGIMRKMKEAGTVNPVFLLDEVDKIGRNGNAGDPTAALLEILDPEQNDTYRDRYLDVPYDLSEALFIITANDIASIPEPLRDRMEIIEFSGYTPFEKMEIAEKHLLPRARSEAGLKPETVPVSAEAMRAIVDGYTRESGVRKLRQVLEKLMRRVSAWTDTKGMPLPASIGAADVETYLGVAEHRARAIAQNGVGLATGLAVNAYGGSTINVEVSHEPGSGKLTLRKQFGDDIFDSAYNALKFVKKNAAKYGVDSIDFQRTDLDIDFTPAGKIDGPSAGSLMATAIISELTGRPVKAGVAMTGEISARGDVLPIGGLPQKVMAAHRMGYTTVIFPEENEKDVASIPLEVRQAMTLIPARTYDDVFAAAFAPAATGSASAPTAPPR